MRCQLIGRCFNQVQAALGIAQPLVNKYGRVFFVNRAQAALGTLPPNRL
jgi:hypothetical protein